MQIIVMLIFISLMVAGGFLFAFFWAVKDGQFEDDYTPSMRILVEDDMLPVGETDNLSTDKTISTTNTNSKDYVESRDI